MSIRIALGTQDMQSDNDLTIFLSHLPHLCIVAKELKWPLELSGIGCASERINLQNNLLCILSFLSLNSSTSAFVNKSASLEKKENSFDETNILFFYSTSFVCYYLVKRLSLRQLNTEDVLRTSDMWS